MGERGHRLAALGRAQLAILDALTVGGLAAVLVVAAPSPALAFNFSGATNETGCDHVNMADNENHYVWNEALTQPTLDAANWVRVYTYNPTVINTYTEDIRTTQTDVILNDYDYEWGFCGWDWRSSASDTSGWIGYTRCLTLSGSACQQFEVRFDTDWMGPKTTAQERYLACHELGHTVGLKHTGQATPACMSENPELANPSTLTSHDQSELLTAYS